jgi:hypothetical protein
VRVLKIFSVQPQIVLHSLQPTRLPHSVTVVSSVVLVLSLLVSLLVQQQALSVSTSIGSDSSTGVGAGDAARPPFFFDFDAFVVDADDDAAG